MAAIAREARRPHAESTCIEYIRANLKIGVRQLVVGVVGLRDDDLILDDDLHGHENVIFGLSSAVADELLHPGAHAANDVINRPAD